MTQKMELLHEMEELRDVLDHYLEEEFDENTHFELNHHLGYTQEAMQRYYENRG